MLTLINSTPFSATLFPIIGSDGGESIGVIGKGTFARLSDREKLTLHVEQVSINFGDRYFKEPSASSLLYAGDVVPEKPGTDVVLIGSAYAPRGEVPEVDVSLQVGPVHKTVRVIGDRTWRSALGLRSTPSRPIPFSVMPLMYERAFGGQATTGESGATSTREPLNPVGRGLPQPHQSREAKELALPNLEDPANLITRLSDRPDPAGFGFIAPHWKWRRQFGGTYDSAWSETRCPLLPNDFDPRFYNAAHPDLVSATPFRGGESVRITNASRRGVIAFTLPMVELQAEFFIDGNAQRKSCALDTIVIEPEEDRLCLTWRASVRCHRQIKNIQGVKLTSIHHDGRR